MKKFIVAEVSKNWPDPSAEPDVLCHRFEDVIAVNEARGYALHSFQFHQAMTGDVNMIETIIAVFVLKEPA